MDLEGREDISRVAQGMKKIIVGVGGGRRNAAGRGQAFGNRLVDNLADSPE